MRLEYKPSACTSPTKPKRSPGSVIVPDYRSQQTTEEDLHQTKDPSVVSLSLTTDKNIRVHAFYCVLALRVARLMVKEAEYAGMHVSVR